MFPPKNRNTKFEIAFHGSASFVHGSPVIDQSWSVFGQTLQIQTYHFIIYRNSMFLVFEEFKRKFITCSTDKLACSHCVRDRQDARFPIFLKSIYWHHLCRIIYHTKKSFSSQNDIRGWSPSNNKNIGFILWALSTETTCTEFTVTLYQTRRLRKHRIIQWKLEQIKDLFECHVHCISCFKGFTIAHSHYDADGWLRN